MNNIYPQRVNKFTTPPTNPLDAKLDALIKHVNAMSTATTAYYLLRRVSCNLMFAGLSSIIP
ncbi:hypothetical protein SARC_09267, partial [Sphaeroforma arctica JP610]